MYTECWTRQDSSLEALDGCAAVDTEWYRREPVPVFDLHQEGWIILWVYVFSTIEVLI
jgi:hypothetical protein